MWSITIDRNAHCKSTDNSQSPTCLSFSLPPTSQVHVLDSRSAVSWALAPASSSESDSGSRSRSGHINICVDSGAAAGAGVWCLSSVGAPWAAAAADRSTAVVFNRRCVVHHGPIIHVPRPVKHPSSVRSETTERSKSSDDSQCVVSSISERRKTN